MKKKENVKKAAGPSLEKEKEWLAQISEKYGDITLENAAEYYDAAYLQGIETRPAGPDMCAPLLWSIIQYKSKSNVKTGERYIERLSQAALKKFRKVVCSVADIPNYLACLAEAYGDTKDVAAAYQSYEEKRCKGICDREYKSIDEYVQVYKYGKLIPKAMKSAYSMLLGCAFCMDADMNKMAYYLNGAEQCKALAGAMNKASKIIGDEAAKQAALKEAAEEINAEYMEHQVYGTIEVTEDGFDIPLDKWYQKAKEQSGRVKQAMIDYKGAVIGVQEWAKRHGAEMSIPNVLRIAITYARDRTNAIEIQPKYKARHLKWMKEHGQTITKEDREMASFLPEYDDLEPGKNGLLITTNAIDENYDEEYLFDFRAHLFDLMEARDD